MDGVYLSILLIFSLVIIFKLINYHLSGGISSPDKGAYLSSALNLAGLDFYHISDPGEIYLSPTISFLTSVLFRLGFVEYSSILYVTAILGLFGIIGLYFLLRYQFDSMMSFTGTIVMLSFSIILWNLASGLLDFPAISMSILIILFTVLAVNKNPKFFIIIFPLFIIGFFTRYTVGFILPIIILYYLVNRDIIEKFDFLKSDRKKLKNQFLEYIKSSEFKYILISVIFGTILLIIYCKVIHDIGSTLGFINQSANSIAGTKGSKLAVDYSDDLLFYVKNFSDILYSAERRFDSTLAASLYLIISFGFIFKFWNIFKNRSKIFGTKQSFQTRNFDKFLKLLILMSIFGIILGIIVSKQLIINIFLLIAFTVFIGIIQKYNIDTKILTFFILNLAWFLINLTYFSYYSIKTYRYIMPVIPSLIYFFVYSFNQLFNLIKNKLKDFKIDVKYANLIPILLIIFLMFSTVSFVDQMGINQKTTDLKEVTQYIIDVDEDYHSKIIFSYDAHHRISRWYLNNFIIPISDDTISWLDHVNADYVIYDKQLNLDNYDEIYHKGEVYLYAKAQ